MPVVLVVVDFWGELLFWVVEGVDAGLASVVVGWRHPFGVAVGVFVGGLAAGLDQGVVGGAGQGQGDVPAVARSRFA
jgi:hypothetical protein